MEILVKHINIFYQKLNTQGKSFANLFPDNYYEEDQHDFHSEAVFYKEGYCAYTPIERILDMLNYPYSIHLIDGNTRIDEKAENWFPIAPSYELYKSFFRDNWLLRMPRDIVSFFSNTNLKLIIWLPWDAVNIFDGAMNNPNGRMVYFIFEALYFLGIPLKKVYFVNSNLNIIHEWDKYLKLSEILFQSAIFFDWHVIPINFFEIYDAYNLTKKYPEKLVYSNNRSKKYICLNGNNKDFRTYIVSELYRRGVAEDGFISLLDRSCTKNTTGNVSNVEALIPNKLLTENFQIRCDMFKQIHDLIPIELDTSSKGISEDDRQLPLSAIKGSYFTVVAETIYTSFANSVLFDDLFITEKTYKPIFYGHPFIVFGQKGILNYLRSIGYYTFPELFDESYDTIADHAERLEFILEQIVMVCKKSQQELDIIMRGLQPKLDHNSDLFINRKKHEWIESILNK